MDETTLEQLEISDVVPLGSISLEQGPITSPALASFYMTETSEVVLDNQKHSDADAYIRSALLLHNMDDQWRLVGPPLTSTYSESTSSCLTFPRKTPPLTVNTEGTVNHRSIAPSK